MEHSWKELQSQCVNFKLMAPVIESKLKSSNVNRESAHMDRFDKLEDYKDFFIWFDVGSLILAAMASTLCLYVVELF